MIVQTDFYSVIKSTLVGIFKIIKTSQPLLNVILKGKPPVKRPEFIKMSTCIAWLYVFLKPRSKKVTVGGEELQKLVLCLALVAFKKGGILQCHPCCVTAPRFLSLV